VKAFLQISSTGEDGLNLEGVISYHYLVAILGFRTLRHFWGIAALLNFHF